MVAQSVRQRFPFTILHPESGLKIDVIIVGFGVRPFPARTGPPDQGLTTPGFSATNNP
jgi:hypothetical protein